LKIKALASAAADAAEGSEINTIIGSDLD